MKIVDFRPGDLNRFGRPPRLRYPWLQYRLDRLPERKGRHGRPRSMLGPWLERARIEFGVQIGGEYTIRGTFVENPLGLALVRYHLPYIQSAAWRLWENRDRKKREHAIEFNDLVSAGLEGLVQATKQWTKQHGGLNAYARHRIHGAICNALYNELHPRGTSRGTPPIAHCSYGDWMGGAPDLEPEELGNPGLVPNFRDISGAAPPKPKNKGRSPCLLIGYHTEGACCAVCG